MKSITLIAFLFFVSISADLFAQKETVSIFQTDYVYLNGVAEKKVKIVDEMSVMRFEENFGKLRSLKYNKSELANRITHIKDSIEQSGVDSILVFRTDSDQTDFSFSIYKRNMKPSKKYRGMVPESWIFPSYIFWFHNGVYYSKSIDQFGVYPTLEVERIHHFQLYDYYTLNQASLEINELLETYPDTIWYDYYDEGEPRFRVRGDIYFYDFSADDSFIPNADFFSIELILGDIRFFKEEQFYKFLPISTSSDNQIANNMDNYHHNQSTAIYQWVLLLEKVVGDLERGPLNSFRD